MTILVTGGLGYVGSHFVWAAAREGASVVVLDDGSGGAPAPLPDGVRLVRGDVGDIALVCRVAREAGVVSAVHFAGKIQVAESVRDPAVYFDVDLARSLRFIDALRASGVPRLVFSSTAAVYGEPHEVPIPESAEKDPVNPYGASKLAIEHALEAYGRAYGLRWAALRYFNAAGAQADGKLRENHDPETHLIPLVLDAGLGRRPPLQVFGEDYPTPDGTCVRDYVHVSDLASAHLAALSVLEQKAVGIANLGTGKGYSVKEVIHAASKVLGKSLAFVRAPRRPGDPPALVADARRATQLLGWEPKRSDLLTIVEDTLRSRR